MDELEFVQNGELQIPFYFFFFFGGNPPNKFHINCFTISNKIKKMGACIMHL